MIILIITIIPISIKKKIKKSQRGNPRTTELRVSVLCSSELIKRVKQLQIGEEATGGDYYQLTYPN